MNFSKLAKITIAGLVVLFAGTAGLYGLPQDYEVVSGDVSVESTDSTLSFNVTSPKAIINLDNFNIGTTETVNFHGPESELLARVTGGTPSVIEGHLYSDLMLLALINPAGIHVTPTGTIDAANIILSTRDITDSNFIAGDYIFEKLDPAQQDMLLLNEGEITISDGGFGVLIAGAIENKGIITAQAGTIALAGGDAMTLDFGGNGLITIAIDMETASTILDYAGNPITDQIRNSGTLNAPGGMIILNAESLTSIFQSVINLEGYVMANSFEEKDGKISIIANGEVIINTELTAETVEIKAPTVTGVDAKIHFKGGYVNVEAQTVNINSEALTTHIIVPEGDITAEEVVSLEGLDIVTIIGGGMGKVSYLKTNNITLEAPQGDVNTSPGVIIPGNQVKISAHRIGSHDNPVGIEANTTYINRIQGAIEITDMWGMGSTITIRGPAPYEAGSDWGAVSYNSSSNLTLEAENVLISGSSPLYLHGNITFSSLEINAPGKEIYFEIGKTYTILGDLNIHGGPDNHVKLLMHGVAEEPMDGSDPATKWYIDPQGERYLTYTWVQDSLNINPEKIIMTNSTNHDNSGNWDPTAYWTGAVSSLWSNPGNWSGLGGSAIPGSGDNVVFGSSGQRDATIDTPVTIYTLTIGEGYNGTITQNENLTLNGAYYQYSGTFEGGLSNSMNVYSTFKLSGGTFNAPQNLNIFYNFTVDGGNFNSNFGNVTIYSYSGDHTVIDAKDVEFYNVAFEYGAWTNGLYIMIPESFTVNNNLTAQNATQNYGHYYVVGYNGAAINVKGDLIFPNNSNSRYVYFGSGLTINLEGNFEQHDSYSYIQATIKMVNPDPLVKQTINQTAGTWWGGSLRIDRPNGGEVEVISPNFTVYTLYLYKGTFNCYYDAVADTGGTLQIWHYFHTREPEGHFVHNKGNVIKYSNSSHNEMIVDGVEFYDLTFEYNNNSTGHYIMLTGDFTVLNNLTAQNSRLNWSNYYVVGYNGATVNVKGDLIFPYNSNGYWVYFGSGLTVNLEGNFEQHDPQSYIQATIKMVNPDPLVKQTINQTAGKWWGGRMQVDRPNGGEVEVISPNFTVYTLYLYKGTFNCYYDAVADTGGTLQIWHYFHTREPEGHFVHNKGNVIKYSNSSHNEMIVDGVEFYDLTFEYNNNSTGHYIMLTGDFTVLNNLTAQNSRLNWSNYYVVGYNGATVNVKGDLIFPYNSNGYWVYFGSGLTVNLEGNFEQHDPQSYIQATIKMVNPDPLVKQTINQTAGTWWGGALYIDRPNGGEVEVISPNFTTYCFYLYNGTFNGYYDAVTDTGGTLQIWRYTTIREPDGHFVHNKGNVIFYSRSPSQVDAENVNFYDVTFDYYDGNWGNIYILKSFTVNNNLYVQNSTSSYSHYYVRGYNSPTITVKGDLIFPYTSNTYDVRFGSGLYVDLEGNYEQHDADATMEATLRMTGPAGEVQTINQTAGPWTGGTLKIQRPNPEDEVTVISSSFETGTFYLNSGTFNSYYDEALDVGGTLKFWGHFFASEPVGHFVHNKGNVKFYSHSAFQVKAKDVDFYDITFDYNSGNWGDIRILESFTVNNNLYVQNSRSSHSHYYVSGYNSPTITVKGDLIFPSTSNTYDVNFGSGLYVKLEGNYEQHDADTTMRAYLTMTGPAGVVQTINKTAGRWTGGYLKIQRPNPEDEVTIISPNFEMGTFYLYNGTFNCYYDEVTDTGGTLKAWGSFYVTEPSGHFVHNKGNVIFYSTVNVDAENVDFYDVTCDYNGGNWGYVRILKSFTVNNNLYVQNSRSSYSHYYVDGHNGATITVKGDLIFPSTSNTYDVNFGSGLYVKLEGNYEQHDADTTMRAYLTMTGPAGTVQTINKTAGRWTGGYLKIQRPNPEDEVTIISPNFEMGTFYLYNGTFNCYYDEVSDTGGTLKAWGSFYVTEPSGHFVHNKGNVIFYSTVNVDAENVDFYDVTCDYNGGNWGYVRILKSFTVNNNLYVQNSRSSYSHYYVQGYNSPTITVKGDLIFPYTSNTYNVQFGPGLYIDLEGNYEQHDGDVDIRIALNFTGTGPQTISQTAGAVNGGTWTIYNDQVTPATGISFRHFVIPEGRVFYTNGQNLTIVNSFSNEGTLRADGGEAISLPMDNNSGTFEYVGTGSYAGPSRSSYYNLLFSGSGTWTLGSNVTVYNDVTIAAGTVNANGKTITLARNWTKDALADFQANGGMVNFNNVDQVSHIAGSTTFNNLACTTAGKSLLFEAGSTQTVTGTLTLRGDTINMVMLRSSVGGTPWNIDMQGTPVVSYTDVKDSNNMNLGNIITTTSSYDSGGNTGWILDNTLAYNWVGLGLDENWTTPENWVNSIIPGSSNKAIFNDKSAKNCSINTSINVGGIFISDTYAGTITQQPGSSITVGGSGYRQAGGTFVGSSDVNDTITLNGVFDLEGGTFTAPAGTMSVRKNFTVLNDGAFDASLGGTVRFLLLTDQDLVIKTPNTTFYNVIFQKSYSGARSIFISDDFTVENDLVIRNDYYGNAHYFYIDDYTYTYPTITIKGNLEFPSTSGWYLYLNSGVTYDLKGDLAIHENYVYWNWASLKFTGEDTQNIDYTAGSVAYAYWYMEKPEGSVLEVTSPTLEVSRLYLNSGTFIAPDPDRDVNGDPVPGTGIMTVRGELSVTDGVFDANIDPVDGIGGTVRFLPTSGYDIAIKTPDTTFYNVIFQKTSSGARYIYISDDFTVENDLVIWNDYYDNGHYFYIDDYTYTNPTVTIKGNLEFPSTSGWYLYLNSGVTYDLKGDLAIHENYVYWNWASLKFTGEGTQNIDYTSGSVAYAY
ncbi:filamentous hemagglutinin N-terminal domain-containing protein, partial [Candidatus Omnitrophota bacterium]